MKRNLLKTMLTAVIVLLGAMNVRAQDYTSYIVNADLTGTDGWNTEGTKGYHSVGGVVTCGNNAQFDFKQTIENLPAGQYKLTAQAAYRYSDSEADEAAAIAAGTETKFASLYATVGSKTASTLVQNRYDGASDTDYANGNGSATVNGKYVPNSTAAVKAWFTAGQYVNEVVFDLPKDGNVTIGIVKTAQPEPGDYTVIGPWTLTRIGDVEVEPDFTSFIVNAEFNPAADPIGWTEVLSGQYRDIGMYQIGGEQMVRFAAPTVDATHLNTEFAAGFECRWSTNYAAYTQTTAELPAGAYSLNFDVENVNGATTKKAYENRFTVTVGETVYTDEATEWMNGKSAWTSHSIKFILTEAAPITISLGYGTGDNNIGSDNTPALYVSHLALGSFDPLADSKVKLQAELEAAQALLATGEVGKEDLEKAIQEAGQAGRNATTVEQFETIIAQLKAAEQAFIDANKLAAAKAELTAKIAEAKAIDTTGKNGADELAAAIATAETAEAASDATIESYAAAVKALQDAIDAFNVANMEFQYQKYLIQNIATQKYWSQANDWGTRASLVPNAEYVKLVPLPNGKYNMETQVNNGGTQYYFNGEWMDNGSPVELTITKIADGKYTIANGDNYYGWDGTTSTVLVNNLAATSENAVWSIIAFDDAKAALANATVDAPMDATLLIENHNFGRNNRWGGSLSTKNEQVKNADLGSAWNFDASNKDVNGDVKNYCVESYHSVFTMSQEVAGAPAGVYALTAQGFYRQDGSDNDNLPYFFANDEKQTFPLKTGSENNMTGASASFTAGFYTIEPIIVKVEEGGTLTIGAKLEENTGLWCIWDNFVLTFYGANATIDQVKNAAIFAEMQELKAKAEELAKDMENATVKAALDAAVAKATAAEGADAINAAIVDLKAAIESAETVNIAKNVLSKMQQLVESTNVYTQEAYNEYYGQWYQKYEAGTLTKAEAAALQDPFVTTGWHASITCDNFLLSAWDTNPDFNEAPYYINTWSVEGENDGTNFKVPFFEYWTGDDNSLGGRTLTATMNGLEKGVYNVNAWVRVRTKNEAGDVEAYGISLQANEGEAVDVTKGDTKVALDKNNNFFLKEVSAKGNVAEDGVLQIKFIVAADNNISWLSFKNVKFEFDAEATGITTIATEKIAADGIFNLAGQKVRNAQKGLYIINGKKVVK